MESPKSSMWDNVPEKWQERYLLKRIGDEDLKLTLQQYNGILKALTEGAKFVKVNKHIIMLNAIKSIDPMWGEDNIPPRPNHRTLSAEGTDFKVYIDDSEGEEWDSYFKNKLEVI